MRSQAQAANSRAPFLDAACRYASRGWPVLPILERGKRPLSRNGVKDATTDLSQIRAWWRHRPQANIGLAVPSGFIVLDFDHLEAIQRLSAQDLSLPTTVSAKTGRGLHLWFTTGATKVGNRVAVFPDVDVRGLGGYVIVPPSIHPNGTPYSWRVELRRSAISECPDWLLERLAEGARPRGRSSEDWLRKIGGTVSQGRRNQSLAEVSGLLFRCLQADIAAEFAYCWAKVKLRPPLPEAEVLRTINSIAGRELRRREGRG